MGVLSADDDREGIKKKNLPGHPPRERGSKSPKPRSQDSAGKNGGHFKSFQAVDIDKNGELTFEEFSAIGRLAKMDEKKRRKLFDFLDRNSDGKLHMRELQSREPSWIASVRKNFAQIDSDNSGNLNLFEFSNALDFTDKPKDLTTRFFSKMDSNNDQVIERSELKWSNRLRTKPQIDFVKYDINQSGGLDFGEYSKLPLMSKCPEERRKQVFARIDTDSNGEISTEEVRAAHKAHRSFSPHGKPSRDRGPMREGKEGEKKHRRHGNDGNEAPKKGDADSVTSPKSTIV